MPINDPNPSCTHRVRDYAYKYAIETARGRGNFCRPSTVINEIIDFGLEVAMQRRRANSL
jgi:hypothetical protein